MYKSFDRSKPFKIFKKCFGFLLAKKPVIVYRTSKEDIESPTIFLCNHGLSGDSTLYVNEVYFPFKFAPIGQFEMFLSFRKRWNYLYTFNHRLRRGMGKFKAFWCSTFKAIFSKTFYGICRAIPSYRDYRSIRTFKQTFRCLNEGISLMIYPERLDMGYNNIFTEYVSGFVSIARSYYKREGKDIKVCAVYYSEATRQLLIDEPFSVIDMLNAGQTKEEIAGIFVDRTNDLYRDYVLPIHQKAEDKYKKKFNTQVYNKK